MAKMVAMNIPEVAYDLDRIPTQLEKTLYEVQGISISTPAPLDPVAAWEYEGLWETVAQYSEHRGHREPWKLAVEKLKYLKRHGERSLVQFRIVRILTQTTQTRSVVYEGKQARF